jgi:SAM-dependent methyltransferase
MPLCCPLCLADDGLANVRGADPRTYFHCQRCWLVFADPRHHLPPADEAARYRLHRNGLEDAGYVAFLRRAIDPLLPSLGPSMRGLDYGCGPSPTLSQILAKHGLACDDYDPLFNDVDLSPPYDFIFATECFEHFFRPAREIARLRALLRPGGYLAVMTEAWTDLDALADWYYMRDPTHVAFYHARTFDCLCAEFGFARLPCQNERVTLLVREGT